MSLNFVEYTSEAGTESGFGSIVEILNFMRKNNIPLCAQVVYAGCGSHNIAFEWERDPIPVPDLSTTAVVPSYDN